MIFWRWILLGLMFCKMVMFRKKIYQDASCWDPWMYFVLYIRSCWWGEDILEMNPTGSSSLVDCTTIRPWNTVLAAILTLSSNHNTNQFPTSQPSNHFSNHCPISQPSMHFNTPFTNNFLISQTSSHFFNHFFNHFPISQPSNHFYKHFTIQNHPTITLTIYPIHNHPTMSPTIFPIQNHPIITPNTHPFHNHQSITPKNSPISQPSIQYTKKLTHFTIA